MSKRRQHNRDSVNVSESFGILGACLLVNGEVEADSLPLSPSNRSQLMQTLLLMAAHYETSARLPPKVFFLRFEKAQLLVLFSRQSQLVLLSKPDARLGELEIAAKKVISTAHIRGSLKQDNPVVMALSMAAKLPENTVPDRLPTANLTNHQPPAQSNSNMTWNEASQGLENIMTKVLSQAQAARLIGAAIQRKGIDTTRPCDAPSFAEIGAEITAKIPSRPIRATLEKEVAEFCAKIG